MSLSRTDTYLGLKISLSDFLLPFLGLPILFQLIRNKTTWPKWRLEHTDKWAVALSCLITFSFLWGWSQTDHFNGWAFYNRLVGWFILLAYFYGAGWLATHYKSILFQFFVPTFVVFCLTTASICTICIILNDLHPHFNGQIFLYPINGFIDNRNAFSILFLAALSLSFFLDRPLYTAWSLFLVPFMCCFNGSRMMLFGLIIWLFFIMLQKTFWTNRTVFLPFLIGIVCLYAVLNATQLSLFRERQDTRLQEFFVSDKSHPESERFSHVSDSVRSELYIDALTDWKDYPVFGIGLGTSLYHQMNEDGKITDLVDSIPLWILSEMGMIGFLLFLSFGYMITKTCWQERKKDLAAEKRFYNSILIFIFFFTLMASVHQLLYARFLWVLLGFALGLRRDEPHNPS